MRNQGQSLQPSNPSACWSHMCLPSASLPACLLPPPPPAVLQFATVMMAISGEAFLAAGRHVTDLLLRNMLDAFANTIW